MDAVTEIKARLSVEDVVSEYVQLKRSGRNFKGLSPFSSEKTPSFMVSPEKQIWHDFSSGKGGDMFSFIMEVEGLDFKGSLELLARKAGIDLEEFKPKGGSNFSGQRDKNRLFEAVEAAVVFYQRQLLKHTESLKYLREKRGYEKQTLLDFRFGYSPVGGSELLKHLSTRGFKEHELKKAGLTTVRGRSSYDMFRGRIMIPLLDPQGRPVGFTARLLKDDKNAPKYINTPATVLYDKSRQVFGLSQAKEAIRKSGFAVLVEGNLDVVASHQAGVKNVVASAGTALTTYHLKSLQRFTGDIRLAFDDDRAGQEAATRAIPLAQSLGVDLNIIVLPRGKDPDELIKQNPQDWITAVNEPRYMVDWVTEKVAESVDLRTAQGKRQFVSSVLGLVRQLKDPVEQEHYARIVAERTNTSLPTIQSKLAEKPSVVQRLKRVKTTNDEPKIAQEQRVREQHLLAISMKYQDIGGKLHGLPLDVFSADAQDTARFVLEHPGVSPSDSEYGKMLTLIFEEHYQDVDEEELNYQTDHLLSSLVKAYAKMKKNTLVSEMDTADEQTRQTLMKAAKQLDDLITQFSKQRGL